MTTAQDIIGFWRDEVGPKGWYDKDDATDEAIRTRFLDDWTRAQELGEAWADTPEGALAAIILTDQFPRNMFRGDGRSYDTDALSRRLADAAIAAGHDMAVEPPMRQFFYLPFMHSEDLADQDRGIALFRDKMPGDNLRHAELHREVIANFGRFPWRNDDLGRASTEAERAFVAAGGYGAMVQGKLSLDGSGGMV
ncbi:MAG: DUF924 family protein [Paracoccus sp. (in: a-proteobacteria)]|nr:DUF924 family protein [Paracoccus sp. (in: a-proteobacteria)]